MESIKVLNLDFRGLSNIMQTLKAVQYDDGRAVRVLLSGTEGTISKARIYCQKPSGKETYTEGSVINDYCVLFGLTPQMLAETGSVKAQLQLMDGEHVVTSFDFQIQVSKNRIASSSITSSDEYQALVEALKDVDRTETEIEKNRSDISEVKNRMTDAERNINVHTSQIAEMQKIPEGGTTADVALNDIKIGYDGTEYESPGEAVRGQINSILERCGATMGTVPDGTNFNTLTETGVWNIDGSRSYTNNAFDSGLLMVYLISGVIYQIEFSGEEARRGWIAFRRRTGHGTTSSPYSWTARKYIEAKDINVSKSKMYLPEKEPGYWKDPSHFVVTDFEKGNYNNDDGILINSDTYMRTQSLFKVREFCGFWVNQETKNNRIFLVFFDKDFNHLGWSRLASKNMYDLAGYLPNVAPKGAVYAGLNYNIEDDPIWPSSVELTIVDGSNLGEIRDPVIGENTDQIFGSMSRVLQGGGIISRISDAYKCFAIPNPKCSRIAVSLKSDPPDGHQCVCVNENGEATDLTSSETYTPIGAIYDIPEGTVMIGINLRQDASSYCVLLYDEEEKHQVSNTKYSREIPYPRLNGKTVAAIGDSITWIDGRNNDGTQRYLMGYQGYMRLCGANVRNYGYSGYTYSVNDQRNSIVGQIVDKIDMSDVDIAVLVGGTNDLAVSASIGEENTDYSHPNVDDTTMIGAIGKLVTYLRAENPKMELFLCTLLPSQDGSRSYAKMKQYNDAIKHCGEFWNIPVIDLYSLMNVHPTSNFSTFFYDGTHPNHVGTERMGKIIASFINNYLSIIG